MALYSQCFGISALVSPLIAGYTIDSQGNAMLIWLFISICCIALLPITNKIKIIN